MIIMKIKDIENRVQRIAELCISDSEQAHIEEDRLHKDFIQYISNKNNDMSDISEMAILCLKTSLFDMNKYYC